MVTKEQSTAKNTSKIFGSGRVSGSMESLSALQLTADMEGLDEESKTVLHSKEVLAIILQETVEEYKESPSFKWESDCQSAHRCRAAEDLPSGVSG